MQNVHSYVCTLNHLSTAPRQDFSPTAKNRAIGRSLYEGQQGKGAAASSEHRIPLQAQNKSLVWFYKLLKQIADLLYMLGFWKPKAERMFKNDSHNSSSACRTVPFYLQNQKKTEICNPAFGKLITVSSG